MSKEIVNRVANSGLITIDLEEKYKKIQSEWVKFDLRDFLCEEMILREKEFRRNLKAHHWEHYKDKFVHLHCSIDAILPGWAYLLAITYLNNYAKKVVFTESNTVDEIDEVLKCIIEDLNIEELRNERVIVKGCSGIPVKQERYLQLATKIQPVVKSIMYGEPCSTVPLYKRKN